MQGSLLITVLLTGDMAPAQAGDAGARLLRRSWLAIGTVPSVYDPPFAQEEGGSLVTGANGMHVASCFGWTVPTAR